MDKNEISLKLLYTALSDELLAWYQYWVCKNLSRGEGKSDADPEFEQHSKEEMEHADKVMKRIKELGGAPMPNPKDWEKFSNPWTEVDTRNVGEQLLITAQAEKDAIAFYTMAVELTEGDITTQQLFKSILEDEEEHLYDLSELIAEQNGEAEMFDVELDEDTIKSSDVLLRDSHDY